jgi:hypothetical protein
MTRSALLALALVVAAVGGPGVRAADAAGRVVGRVVQESRRPAGPVDPVPDVDVLLVPYTPALLERLEAIKRQARQDVHILRSSAVRIDEALQAEGEALKAGGKGEAPRSARTDVTGGFDISDVPPGAWLLVARSSTFVPKNPSPIGHRERQVHRPTPRLAGFSAVDVWVRSLDVAAERPAEVELTDRNVWMRAIGEERTTDPGR